MPDPKYEVWVIWPGQAEYRLLGRTNDQDGAESYCEGRVLAGVYVAAKVVETATGRILVETES